MTFKKYIKTILKFAEEGLIQSDTTALSDEDKVYFATYNNTGKEMYVSSESYDDDEIETDKDKALDTAVKVMPIFIEMSIKSWLKKYFKNVNKEDVSVDHVISYVIDEMNKYNRLYEIAVADIKDEEQLKNLIIVTNTNINKIRDMLTAEVLQYQVKQL